MIIGGTNLQMSPSKTAMKEGLSEPDSILF
jgi:hypothetical protein